MTMVARSKIITFGRRELLIKSALVRPSALLPILNLLLRLKCRRSVLKPPGEPTSAADMRDALLQDMVQIVEGRVGRAFVASVLVLEGQELQHAAAPGLPACYKEAVNGLLIGPHVGSCGTAAFRGHPIYVQPTRCGRLIRTSPGWHWKPACGRAGRCRSCPVARCWAHLACIIGSLVSRP